MQTYRLDVFMHDGTVRTFQGHREELARLKARILHSMDLDNGELVTFDLSTEGVMLLASSIAGVGEIRSVAAPE